MIEFGEVNPKLLVLLIYPVGIILARLIGIHNECNPYFYLFLFFISHFFSLIPLAIYKTRKYIYKNRKMEQENKSDLDSDSKNRSSINDDSETMQNQLHVLKAKIEKDKKKNKILIFLLIGVQYFFTYCFFYYFNYITPTTEFYGNISMVTEVAYFTLFNWIISGNKIYSHHLFAMLIITISIFALYILLIVKYIKYKEGQDISPLKDFILPTLLNLLVYCPFCLFLVQSKEYIEKYFVSPYQMIFYLGIFCLSILIIFEPITFLISCEQKVICNEGHFAGIISGFKQARGNKGGYILSFGMAFTLFMTALGLWLTVKFLSPLHFLTSDGIITLELNILIDSYNKHLLIEDPLFYFFSLITLFGCLIYNEIIIIGFCKLNYNTRKQIIKRQSKDFRYINYELPERTEKDSTFDSIDLSQ